MKQLTIQKILNALKNSGGNFISGEELAANVGMSRTAIWKHVQTLRNKGYKIEAVPKRGYRLVTSTDLLLPCEIIPLLKTETIGKKIYYDKSIDSTNDKAKNLAQHGTEEGTIVITEEQVGGKGRLGRKWISPKGGIWLSIILRPKIAPTEASRLTILSAVVVAKAIEELGLKAQIKWPNDILVNNKKICGILLELSAQPDVVDYIVVGIGINANFGIDVFPENEQDKVTTLSKELGVNIDRPHFLANLLKIFEREYKKLLHGEWADIKQAWMSNCLMANNYIKLSTINGEVEGKCVGIDDFGMIQLKLSDGSIKSFSAGDVTISKQLT